MNKSRFSLGEKAEIVHAHKSGTRVQTLCCKHNITSATFYAWRKKLPEWQAQQKAKEEQEKLFR